MSRLDELDFKREQLRVSLQEVLNECFEVIDDESKPLQQVLKDSITIFRLANCGRLLQDYEDLVKARLITLQAEME